jgi:hypothetical protein
MLKRLKTTVLTELPYFTVGKLSPREGKVTW